MKGRTTPVGVRHENECGAGRGFGPGDGGMFAAIGDPAFAASAAGPAPDFRIGRRRVASHQQRGVFAVAAPAGQPGRNPAPNPVIIREEVLLDRARFSPGEIDGKSGGNERHALAVYQAQAGLSPTGNLDTATWSRLTRDPRPAAEIYALTPADVAGPFAPDVGEDFVKLAALPKGPLYSSPLEALAERFHMSQALLAGLNPGADFSKAGTPLVVAATGAPGVRQGRGRAH